MMMMIMILMILRIIIIFMIMMMKIIINPDIRLGAHINPDIWLWGATSIETFS